MKNAIAQNITPIVKPVVQILVETAIKMAYTAFDSNDYRIRLIKNSHTKKSDPRYRYVVDFGKEDDIQTVADFRKLIFEESKIEIAKADDLTDALEMAETLCNSILNSLVKEKKSLNGIFDKNGQRFIS